MSIRALRGLLQAVLLLTYIKTSLGNSNYDDAFDEELKVSPVRSAVQRVHNTPTGTYDVRKVPVTWHKAYENCHRDGYHLVVINSAQEAEELKGIMREQAEIGRYHVGVHRLFTLGEFRMSIFGKELEKTGYEEWAPGEPTGAATEHCNAMNINALFIDINCGQLNAYICEAYV